jgi:hypothetical protein
MKLLITKEEMREFHAKLMALVVLQRLFKAHLEGTVQVSECILDSSKSFASINADYSTKMAPAFLCCTVSTKLDDLTKSFWIGAGEGAFLRLQFFS